jgi:hypothetical protein
MAHNRRAVPARRVSVPVRPPACAEALAPRRLIFLTSPPTARARRRGQKRLCYSSKQAGGGPIRKRTGKTRNPPARFQVSPRPPFLPLRTDATRRANDRGKCADRQRIPRRTCQTMKLQGARGTREPPQSPVRTSVGINGFGESEDVLLSVSPFVVRQRCWPQRAGLGATRSSAGFRRRHRNKKRSSAVASVSRLT